MYLLFAVALLNPPIVDIPPRIDFSKNSYISCSCNKSNSTPVFNNIQSHANDGNDT